jgi:hypothetical protein
VIYANEKHWTYIKNRSGSALVMIGVGEFAGIRLPRFSSGEFTGEGLIAFFAVQAVMVGC